MLHGWQCLLAVGQVPPLIQNLRKHLFFFFSRLPPQTLTPLSSGWVKPAGGVDQGGGSSPATLLPGTTRLMVCRN